MKNKDLIELLSTMPEDATVEVFDPDTDEMEAVNCVVCIGSMGLIHISSGGDEEDDAEDW